MEIEAILVVKKILHVEGPKDVETAIILVRQMLEGKLMELSTFQKWKPAKTTSTPIPCEELIYIVDLRPPQD